MRIILLPTDASFDIFLHPRDRDEMRSHLFAALSHPGAHVLKVENSYPFCVGINMNREDMYGAKYSVFCPKGLESEIEGLVVEAQQRALKLNPGANQ